MRKANLIAGIVLFIFSLLLYFWLIPSQIEETLGEEVSARLLPQICAIGIGLLSVLLVVNALRGATGAAPAGDRSPISWFEARALLVIGGLLALGIWMFTAFGPVPASVIVMVGILAAMGERRVLPYLLIPAVLLSASYLLFYKVLGTAIV